jgi:hypothetical protein
MEGLIFGKALAEHEGALGVDEVVLVRGRIDHGDKGTSLIAQTVEPFAPTPEEVEAAREAAALERLDSGIEREREEERDQQPAQDVPRDVEHVEHDSDAEQDPEDREDRAWTEVDDPVDAHRVAWVSVFATPVLLQKDVR